MLAIQAVLKAAPKICSAAVQSRSMSVISGPPRNKIAFAEKAVLGGIMIVSLCVVPSWVLVHMKVYTAGQ